MPSISALEMMAAQAAVRQPIADDAIERAVLDLVHRRQPPDPFLRDVDVAGRAQRIAAAQAQDPGHISSDPGLTQRLPDWTLDLPPSAIPLPDVTSITIRASRSKRMIT